MFNRIAERLRKRSLRNRSMVEVKELALLDMLLFLKTAKKKLDAGKALQPDGFAHAEIDFLEDLLISDDDYLTVVDRMQKKVDKRERQKNNDDE